MGETPDPLPPVLQASLSQGPLPPCQSPHLLPRHLSAAALPILGPVPCPGAQACHRAPSINNRSGPTDHSPTRAQPQPPGHALRTQWPPAGSQARAPRRKHQLPTDSKPGGQPAGWRAGAPGPQVGLVEESQYSQGGRGETLPFCTPVTSSRAPVRSRASVGASAEPLGMGSPVRGWTDARAQGLGLPLSYRSPA